MLLWVSKVVIHEWSCVHKEKLHKSCKNQGCYFRTVPAGTAGIFRVSAWTGTETGLIRTVLNTGVFRLVSADSGAFRAVSSFWTGTN